MRLLVCEFITGGGLLNQPLPDSLAREGELMLQAMLADLVACQAVTQIDVLRDTRLPAIRHSKCRTIQVADDFMAAFAAACQCVDAVLPIAPESDRTLWQLSRMAETAPVRLWSSNSDVVAVATSKQQTAAILTQQQLPVIPVYDQLATLPHVNGDWVIKPDAGVGGENCRRHSNLPVSLAPGYVVQPYIDGRAASLTLLCRSGEAALVAVNEQYIDLDEHGCRLRGVHVNGGLLLTLDTAQRAGLQQLAAGIAAALPGLWGWVGVDLVYTADGPLIVEVNPRLTTAYCGLARSHGCNPANWLLELALGDRLPALDIMQSQSVEVLL